MRQPFRADTHAGPITERVTYGAAPIALGWTRSTPIHGERPRIVPTR
jgi:hypothetical protein